MTVITPTLLANLRTALRTAFTDQYEATRADTFWMDVATDMPSSTELNTYGWLKDFSDLREWIGDRVINDMESLAYQIINRLYEGTVGVPRVKIEDDNIGQFSKLAAHRGQRAAEHPDKMIAEVMKNGTSSLCYDGQNFFDTDHPVYPNADGTGVAVTHSNYQAGTDPGWFLMDTRGVLKPFIFQERTKPEFDTLTDASKTDSVFMKDQYLYGIRYRCGAGYGFWQNAYFSKQPLTAANFEAAMDAMGLYEADGGRPLGVTPNLLVVPTPLRSAARKIVSMATINGGEDNPNYKATDLKVVPWINGV